MKGISSFIEYTLVIALGAVLLSIAAYMAYSFYNTALENSVRNELKQVAIQTSESVLKLYEIGKNSKINPPLNATVLIATETIPLPSDLAGKNYKITLVPSSTLWAAINNITVNQVTMPYTTATNANVQAESTQYPLVSVTQDMPNLDIYVQGSSRITNSTLAYYRYNINGNISDVIMLGTSNVFIQVQEVS